MHAPLRDLPTFAPESFAARIAAWRKLPTTPGQDRVVIEWGIGQGPKVIVYPAASRPAGFSLLEGAVGAANDERWADFLETAFLPQVVQAVEGAGGRAQVVCVDQRPIQTMRVRRRDQQRAAH